MKKILVLDTETTGKFGDSKVYDLGIAIADEKGCIYEERSYLIWEIFTHSELMKVAYFANKIPQYRKDWLANKHTMVRWERALEEVNSLVKKYEVETVAAYNMAFDKRAIASTHKFLKKEGKPLPHLDHLCIWGMACQTIFCEPNFGEVATEQGWITKAGNYLTDAETAHRYLTHNYGFKEEHTGLEDVRIEVGIMARCNEIGGYTGGVISHPWRIPQERKGA